MERMKHPRNGEGEGRSRAATLADLGRSGAMSDQAFASRVSDSVYLVLQAP